MLNKESYPDYFKIDVKDHIAFLTLHRPDRENRFNHSAELPEFRRFMKEANDTDDIRVIVMTGAGDQWFSAGALPEKMDEKFRTAMMDEAQWDNAWLRELLEHKKPVITALNGNVMGRPLTWVMASDLVIAERHAKMCDNHVLGGASSATGPYLWPLSSGIMKAKRWILTGDWLDAATAESIGLVTEVVETGKSLERSMELAKRLASLRPESLWLTKRNLNAWLVSRNDDLFVPALISEIATLP